MRFPRFYLGQVISRAGVLVVLAKLPEAGFGRLYGAPVYRIIGG